MKQEMPLVLLDPWVLPTDPEALVKEFQREVRGDGCLHRVRLKAIAMRCDCDHVLFKLLDGTDRVAVVHLTWSGATDPNRGWPETTLHDSIENWRTECMLPDHQEYTQ